MTSSVDPRLDTQAILARLRELPEETYYGIPQGEVLPVNAFGQKAPYRDVEPGSLVAASGGRILGAGSQSQPHVWSFQVHHVAASRTEASEMAIATDMSLIGWAPSNNSGPIGVFYFHMYDAFDDDGETLKWIASRFYETTLGASPDL